MVMVADDHVEAERRGERELVDVRRPAVGGDEDAGARLRQRVDRPGVEPVALTEPVRDVEQRVGAELAEEEDQLRRTGDAVDVVVAVDGDPLAARQRIGEAGRGDLHVLQEERRAEAPGQRGPQERERGLAVTHVAVPEEPREQRGGPQARARERGGKALRLFVRPSPPDPPRRDHPTLLPPGSGPAPASASPARVALEVEHDRARHEDRRVRADDEADQQREGEAVDHPPTEQEQRGGRRRSRCRW